MHEMILDPLQMFDEEYRDGHRAYTERFFEELVCRAGIDIDSNRDTIRQIGENKALLAQLRASLKWRKFWRVVCCITIFLIPLVFLSINPKIKELQNKIREEERREKELLEQAKTQMRPLNQRLTDRDALDMIEAVIPQFSFQPRLSREQEADMAQNFDFEDSDGDEQSTIDILAGSYQGNPFFFGKKLICTEEWETYRGKLNIQWTETEKNARGEEITVTRTQVLEETVEAPKYCYHTQTVLHYCSQGGPDLSFGRKAGHWEGKNDRQIERAVRHSELERKRLADKAVKQNSGFTSMANSLFESLFNALNRDNEHQFRLLFTPLAQNNMTALLRSGVGYGDDFSFEKRKRTNHIISEHSQNREICLRAESYRSHSYDEIRENFLKKNEAFFKAVYFDFAPLLAIPLYQERPIGFRQTMPASRQQYSTREYEVLANALDPAEVVHPSTDSLAILKPRFIASRDGVDEICIDAYSYRIVSRTEYVPARGKDGRMHDVPVEWDEYTPLHERTYFYVTARKPGTDKAVMACRDGLYIYQEK